MLGWRVGFETWLLEIPMTFAFTQSPFSRPPLQANLPCRLLSRPGRRRSGPRHAAARVCSIFVPRGRICLSELFSGRMVCPRGAPAPRSFPPPKRKEFSGELEARMPCWSFQRCVCCRGVRRSKPLIHLPPSTARGGQGRMREGGPSSIILPLLCVWLPSAAGWWQSRG